MATPTTLPASFTAGQVLTAAQMNDLRGAFRILQVVQTVKKDTFSTASTSFVDVTGLTVAITPSAATNKILVVADVKFAHTATANTSTAIRLNGGNSNTYIADAASNRTVSADGMETGVLNWDDSLGHYSTTLFFLDSPATTSATTYAVQTRAAGGGGGSAVINRSGVDTDSANYVRFASSITVFEVSA